MKKLSMILSAVLILSTLSFKSNAYTEPGAAYASGHNLSCIGFIGNCFSDGLPGGHFVSGGLYFIYFRTGTEFAQIFSASAGSGTEDEREFVYIPAEEVDGDLSFFSISDSDNEENCLVLNEEPIRNDN